MARATDALTVRGRSFLAAGAALIVCGMVLGFQDVTRLGVLAAGLPVLVLLLTSRQRLRIRARRTVTPARVHIDEACDVTLVLENVGALATPILMAEEQLDYALGDRPRFVVPKMAPDEQHRLPYRVRSNVRGRHRLGPLAVRVKDPFELTMRLAALPGAGELIVLPRVVDLARGEGSGGMGNEGTIPHMVALHGEDDVSVRQHRDGDDLRRIHWPATAKTGDLMVRQEDRPARRRALIVLDDRTTTSAGPRSNGSFEWAVTAVASLAKLFIESGLATHVVHGGRSVESPTEDTLTLDDALASLAVAELEDPLTFGHSLDVAGDIGTAGAISVAVIGPMSDDDARRLSRLRAPGAVGAALVLDLGGDGRPGSGSATSTAALLRDNGWAAFVVASGVSVQEAWLHLTSTVTGVRR